jgi:L-lactate dehydrogenase
MTPTPKIAVVGAGAVGATFAYATLVKGISSHVGLYDIDARKVHAQVLDLNHGLQFVSPARVEGSDDPAVCAGASVVVITAGAKQKPGQTRLDLAAGNVAMFRSLVPQLLRVAPEALFLIVTNPVDVLTYVCQRISRLPPEKVVGSGTVLDSSRFRFLIAQRLRVAVASVQAMIVGEHGQSAIPLWSTAAVEGVPLKDWAVPGHGKLTVPDRAKIVEEVKDAARQIIEGKGATSYAIGLAAAEILQAILDDQQRVLPVSTVVEGWREIGDVALSLPSIVGARGASAPLPVPMNDAEYAGLIHSAEIIRGAIRDAGF